MQPFCSVACMCAGCKNPATNVWINTSNERMPVCDGHLFLIQRCYDYVELKPNEYKIIPLEEDHGKIHTDQDA